MGHATSWAPSLVPRSNLLQLLTRVQTGPSAQRKIAVDLLGCSWKSRGTHLLLPLVIRDAVLQGVCGERQLSVARCRRPAPLCAVWC